ncbi:MAG: hypothetical protein IT211_04060 [Armatimonadetes bacterium]|nr:hypothetical protein [Armatimonadota bacterium]
MTTTPTINQKDDATTAGHASVLILTEMQREELRWLVRVLPIRYLPIKRRIRTLLMSVEGFSEHALSVLFSATPEVIQQWKHEWCSGGMEHLYGVMKAEGIATTELRKVWVRVGQQSEHSVSEAP